jgi:hypothetical protein
MPFPQITTLVDDFNRTDGALNAGDGSSKWTGSALGGGSGGWSVSSNKAAPNSAGANHLSLVEMPGDGELVATLSTVGSGGAYVAVFFKIQNPTSGSWEAYWFFYEPGSSFQLRKRVGGSTSTLAGLNLPSEMAELSAGDAIGIHHVDGVLRVRVRRAGVWDQTPIIDVTDTSISVDGPVAFEASGAFTLDDLMVGAATAEDGGGGGDTPTEPVTIYVDADHPSANDTRTRIEASDPATPLKTIQAAAALAYATPTWADTIQVEPATNANALDTLDTSVYASMHHRITGTDVLPFGDNSGNEPITIQGHVVSGQKPKVRGIDGRQLKNWVIQDLQQGYDIGSGDDNLTIGSLVDVADLTFRRIDYTGGCYDIKVWDDLLFEDCLIRSPYSSFQGGGNRFLDGVGVHIAYIDNSTGDEGVGLIHFLNCTFDEINGEDAIQASLGGVGGDYLAGHLLVEGCNFLNVIGVEGKAHTDAIQILGGQLFEIRDCVFFNCDDAFIASDFHNGKIVFENNLVAYCGNPCSGQGTDEWVIRHNTIIHSFFGTGMSFGQRTEGITQKITMVNNIMDDYAIADDVDVHPDSVISHNILLLAPSGVGAIGQVAEFGTSTRMNTLPSFTSSWAGSPPTNYELATAPAQSPGIGDGLATDLLVDRLGRVRSSSAPDIGCHEHSSLVVVTAASRAPYVVDRMPAPGATDVAATSHVIVTLSPKPGEEVDSATVTNSSFYLVDPAGNHIPALSIFVNELDENGNQTVVLDLAGALYPMVSYTAHMTTTVADTEGSSLSTEVAWSFRTEGLGGPGYFPGGSGGSGSAPGWTLGRVG